MEDKTLANLTAEEFEARFGFPPTKDNLEKVNCAVYMSHSRGHPFCGICSEHNQPRFVCGCSNSITSE